MLQPMDQGVINSIKIQLVLETIQNIEESKSTQINILRTIFMVKNL